MMALNLKLPKSWRSASVWALYVVGLTPALWQFYRGATGNLGADPVKTFEHFLGLWALRFIILTLAVSPLRDLGGPNLIRYRRALGLLSFYYVVMHFAVYLVLDQTLVISAVLADVLKRPFIMFGMASLLMLVPLAVTSNNFSIKRLRGNWARLHRLVYVIAVSAGLHYALSTKVLSTEQYFYLILIATLLIYRLVRRLLPRRRRRTNSTGSIGLRSC